MVWKRVGTVTPTEELGTRYVFVWVKMGNEDAAEIIKVSNSLKLQIKDKGL